MYEAAFITESMRNKSIWKVKQIPNPCSFIFLLKCKILCETEHIYLHQDSIQLCYLIALNTAPKRTLELFHITYKITRQNDKVHNHDWHRIKGARTDTFTKSTTRDVKERNLNMNWCQIPNNSCSHENQTNTQTFNNKCRHKSLVSTLIFWNLIRAACFSWSSMPLPSFWFRLIQELIFQVLVPNVRAKA